MLDCTYNNLRRLILKNAYEYENGLYDVNISDRIIKAYRPKQFVLKKSDFAEILRYREHRQIIAELRRNKIAYRKAMKNKYGLHSFATEHCTKANYNCSKCLNKGACKIANNKPFVKRLTYILNILEGRFFNPSISVDKLTKKIDNLEKENLDLRLKLTEMQAYCLKVKKEFLSSIERCENA